MSASDHLGQQFDHISQVPYDGRVHHVKTEGLHDAYMYEFDVRGRDVEHGFSEMQNTEGVPDHLIHPTNTPARMNALTESVRKEGVKEPLSVAFHPPNTEDGKLDFSVLDGTHRYLAAKRAGTPTIPVRLRR